MRKFPILLFFMFGINAGLVIIWFNKFGIQQQDFPELPPEPTVKLLIPDFAAIQDIKDRKRAYFNYIAPVVEQHNRNLLEVRAFLTALDMTVNEDKPLSPSEQNEIKNLAQEYKVNYDQPTQVVIDELLVKVDIIPVELVLVQSANESAWGTSRFAQQGFNFFGLWCFVKDCGFVPSRRNDGASHEVAKFTSLDDAVYTYMRNLNRHYAYAEMREIRSELRQNGGEVTANELVIGLTRYSERGVEYVEELQAMLRINKELMEL